MDTESKLLNNIDIHLFGIEITFAEFNDYQKLLEGFLEKEKANFEKLFKDIQHKLETETQSIEDPAYQANVLETGIERHFEISVLYPHNFRASFLTQIFAFIEFELKKICDYHHKLNNTDYSINDLKGNSEIEKAKVYLTKSCKIHFDKLEPEWGLINKIKLIRNKLVHHQGIIEKSDKDWKPIVSYIKEFDLGMLKDNVFIINNREFNERFLKISESFFKKLLYNELKLK